ncbi:hypothetical protein JB92DRAFT_3098971 [Gautieria morchelliformis]|nr:hypothetical protein JB92DRAFT_3098971 [Gautieria morchelliformis]
MTYTICPPPVNGAKVSIAGEMHMPGWRASSTADMVLTGQNGMLIAYVRAHAAGDRGSSSIRACGTCVNQGIARRRLRVIIILVDPFASRVRREVEQRHRRYGSPSNTSKLTWPCLKILPRRHLLLCITSWELLICIAPGKCVIGWVKHAMVLCGLAASQVVKVQIIEVNSPNCCVKARPTLAWTLQQCIISSK